MEYLCPIQNLLGHPVAFKVSEVFTYRDSKCQNQPHMNFSTRLLLWSTPRMCNKFPSLYRLPHKDHF